MREILFRGKRADNGEWIYGFLSKDPNGKCFILWHEKYIPDTRDWDQAEFYENNPKYKIVSVEIIPETLGQFIGILDIKGKQIFEGDLIRIDHSQHNGRRFVVGFDKHKCAFDFTWSYNGGGMQLLSTDINYPIEVTGSIHSNETA